MIFRSDHFTDLSGLSLTPLRVLGRVLFLGLDLPALSVSAMWLELKKGSSRIVSRSGVWLCWFGVDASFGLSGIGENADTPGTLLMRMVPGGRGGFIAGGALAGAGGCWTN